ncbi:uncharacterized protein [Nicotiana tomentosiformis]|uniref:uncharacterized protein isoform X2 n=1 Tax=Nicotiana tomentosiformis TaxID=4098 RepID=UPI00051AB4E9|nr:tetratricopeptide repeat protein 5-like isoform X3 [Nicotiana tomentosiformis]
MSISTGKVAGEDLFAKATAAADELYSFRDNYFPLSPEERVSKLQIQSDLALQILDTIPIEKRKLPLQRATYEYLRGKVLDVVPVYKKEAEDHLSKAVKLNPSLVDAWLCLGNCIWKKGDLNAAKNCFTFALSKGPSKNILCQLSMLERKLAQDAENPEEVVDESIKHAREAITLDVKDGYSWYNLGNAFLTSFFVTGAWDHNKLLQSLKAYQNAVNKYLENYERALTGFEAAALMDPGLNAVEDARMMVLLLDKLDYLLRGQSKAKRLSSLSSSLATVDLSPSYKRATMDLLSEGLNKGYAIIGKVLFFAKNESLAPLYYVLSDSNHTFYVISVYGIRSDAIKEGDQVTLMEPFYRFVDFSWKGKRYQFKSVRVDFVEQVLVNGKCLFPHHAARTSIYAQLKA